MSYLDDLLNRRASQFGQLPAPTYQPNQSYVNRILGQPPAQPQAPAATPDHQLSHPFRPTPPVQPQAPDQRYRYQVMAPGQFSQQQYTQPLPAPLPPKTTAEQQWDALAQQYYQDFGTRPDEGVSDSYLQTRIDDFNRAKENQSKQDLQDEWSNDYYIGKALDEQGISAGYAYDNQYVRDAVEQQAAFDAYTDKQAYDQWVASGSPRPIPEDAARWYHYTQSEQSRFSGSQPGGSSQPNSPASGTDSTQQAQIDYDRRMLQQAQASGDQRAIAAWMRKLAADSQQAKPQTAAPHQDVVSTPTSSPRPQMTY